MRKKLSILGSTGSIGRQTLQVAKALGVKVLALSAKSNIKLLEEQIREYKPEYAVVFDETLALRLKNNVKDMQIKILSGMDGLCQISSIEDCDIVLNALTGMIGLKPTLKAIEAKIDVAIANKETLVVGGDLVMNYARDKNVKIIPVDSEHSAIFQCLQGCREKKTIKNLILTASGGPFWDKTEDDLKNVTIEQTLKHPNWSMGPKNTVDSATMMNKGLEIIEAIRLFGISEDKIKVLIHRESIVHSMVEYCDGSIIAQMSITDMKIPIQYALTFPDRTETFTDNFLDLTKFSLTFFEPKPYLSKCMDLCRSAVKTGGTAPVILNAANEEAVRMFLDKKIRFLDIWQIVEDAIKNIPVFKTLSLDDIIDCDLKTREYVNRLDV